MTIEQLQVLLSTGEMNKVMGLCEQRCPLNTWGNPYRRSPLREYDVQDHLVKDTGYRKDKSIKDENGNSSMVRVARLPLPLQKKIVQTAAAFLGTPTIKATAKGANEARQKDLLEVMGKVSDSNKMDYKFFSIAEITMSERHCAELWYAPKADPTFWDDYPIKSIYKLSVKLLANSLGDHLYPVFDDYGNMIAFGRGYKVKNELGNDVQHFDLYTDATIYYTRNDGVWQSQNEAQLYVDGITGIKNPFGKIPVIYYCQPKTEWDEVQDLIDRLEKKISNHADTNDYFDSPIALFKGKMLGLANSKGESGKAFEMENDADFGYATWDTLPESMKMELERLYEDIFKFTSTPDISFDKMSSLGVFSGIAIKMFFVDAHLKAMRKAILFGEGLQRRFNFLKVAINVISSGAFKSAISLEIKPKFEFFMPANDGETIDNLVKLVTNGLISLETAVGINPYVTDAVEELKRINTEKEAAQAQALEIAQQSKPDPSKELAVA
jgi:SPP1 family phage portal protein